MDAEILAALVRYVKTGLVVLQTRFFVLLGLLLCAGAFAWTLWGPTYERIVASCAFAVLVYLPLLRLEGAKNGRQLASEETD